MREMTEERNARHDAEIKELTDNLYSTCNELMEAQMLSKELGVSNILMKYDNMKRKDELNGRMDVKVDLELKLKDRRELVAKEAHITSNMMEDLRDDEKVTKRLIQDFKRLAAENHSRTSHIGSDLKGELKTLDRFLSKLVVGPTQPLGGLAVPLTSASPRPISPQPSPQQVKQARLQELEAKERESNPGTGAPVVPVGPVRNLPKLEVQQPSAARLALTAAEPGDDPVGSPSGRAASPAKSASPKGTRAEADEHSRDRGVGGQATAATGAAAVRLPGIA